MKYAITGHRGLIGDCLKKRLNLEGHECVLNIDQEEGFNVIDLMFKETKLNDKIDVFFHFAAQCKINESIAIPMLAHKNNADGIISVLEFCRKNEKPGIVVASTSRVLAPERNPYVASKIYVEELTKAYSHCYGLEYLIVRPSTVYGPMFDRTSRLMNNFITSAFKGEDLLIYGDKTKTLDFTFSDDFVDGVMLAINNGWNKEYNISGEQEELILDVAEKVIKEIGSKSKIKFLPPERAQPQKVKIDISAIKQIGYVPKISIDEGIKRMVDWYREHPEAIKLYRDRGLEYYNGGN